MESRAGWGGGGGLAVLFRPDTKSWGEGGGVQVHMGGAGPIARSQ